MRGRKKMKTRGPLHHNKLVARMIFVSVFVCERSIICPRDEVQLTHLFSFSDPLSRHSLSSLSSISPLSLLYLSSPLSLATLSLSLSPVLYLSTRFRSILSQFLSLSLSFYLSLSPISPKWKGGCYCCRRQPRCWKDTFWLRSRRAQNT